MAAHDVDCCGNDGNEEDLATGSVGFSVKPEPAIACDEAAPDASCARFFARQSR